MSAWVPSKWKDVLQRAFAVLKAVAPEAIGLSAGDHAAGRIVQVHVVRPGTPAARVCEGLGQKNEDAWANCVRSALEQVRQQRSELDQIEQDLLSLLNPPRGTA